MDALIAWVKKLGIGWETAIDLGLLLYSLGQRLAEREGVDPTVLQQREALAMQRLNVDLDKLLDELRAIVKP